MFKRSMLGLMLALLFSAHGHLPNLHSTVLENLIIRFYDYIDSCNEHYENAFYRHFAQEEGAANDKNYVIISLGCNCRPAWELRRNKVRSFAFPFDWNITPFQALYGYFSTHFAYFFEKKNLVTSKPSLYPYYLPPFLQKMNYKQDNNWVLDKKYGSIFNHDFPDNSYKNIHTHYAENYAKYKRRIDRLYAEMRSGKHIYFIRHYDITKEQAQQLYVLLKQKFPSTPITLLVTERDEKAFGTDWGIKNIKNYYLDKDGQNDAFWDKLCQDMDHSLLH